MIKYNYLKAAKIWDALTDITFDMQDYIERDTQQIERRIFLKALTRGDKSIINSYLDYIHRYIYEVEPAADIEKDLKKIALQIVFFTNENNY